MICCTALDNDESNSYLEERYCHNRKSNTCGVGFGTSQPIGAGKAENRLLAEAGEMVNNLLVSAKKVGNCQEVEKDNLCHVVAESLAKMLPTVTSEIQSN